MINIIKANSVSVNSGLHKGLKSNSFSKRGKVYEIRTSKGIVLVHESRCSIEEGE